ncbi:hypothetical protein ACLKA6_004576 [Drosophila palustris]
MNSLFSVEEMDNHSLFQQIPARLDQLEKDMQMIIKNQSNILAILQKLTHHDIHDIPEDFPVNTVEELDKLDKQISKDVPKYYKIIAKIIRGDLAKNLDGILGPDLIMMLHYDGILGKMPFKQYFNVNNALLSKSTICDWYSNFKRGRTSTEDSKRSGRPKEVIIPEIIRQVRQIVLTDRRVKVREIAESVGISTGSAVSILHDHLHMKKLNVKWVPHFLDIEQREKRVADSKSCLDMFNRNPSEFLRRYITMDETWIHHYIPESNRSSAEWREAGESRSKRVKASRWAASVGDGIHHCQGKILRIAFKKQLNKQLISKTIHNMLLLSVTRLLVL